jgi:hypothetical protein
MIYLGQQISEGGRVSMGLKILNTYLNLRVHCEVDVNRGVLNTIFIVCLHIEDLVVLKFLRKIFLD